jgi:hypothetical protein
MAQAYVTSFGCFVDNYIPYSSRVFLARPTKVRHYTWEEARPLSQVRGRGCELTTSSGYEVAGLPQHHHIITLMQD